MATATAVVCERHLALEVAPLHDIELQWPVGSHERRGEIGLTSAAGPLVSELDGGEAHERVDDDIEPQWVVVCIEGKGGNSLVVEEMAAGPLVIDELLVFAHGHDKQYEVNPIKASDTHSL